MARPLRIEYAGALYHVTSRGNAQEAIYRDDKDRRDYYSVVFEVCKRFNWVIHAYCLMDNHYHLLVETPEGDLSKKRMGGQVLFLAFSAKNVKLYQWPDPYESNMLEHFIMSPREEMHRKRSIETIKIEGITIVSFLKFVSVLIGLSTPIV